MSFSQSFSRHFQSGSKREHFISDIVFFFQLNHLTLMELNTVRPFLTQALDHMHMLRTNISGRIQSTQD